LRYPEAYIETAVRRASYIAGFLVCLSEDILFTSGGFSNDLKELKERNVSWDRRIAGGEHEDLIVEYFPDYKCDAVDGWVFKDIPKPMI
jgi:hypothetical protein